MTTNANRTFQLHRFQIVPTFALEDFDLNFLPDFEIKSAKELIKKKNELFERAIREVDEFQYKRTSLTHELYQKKNFLVLHLGARRGLLLTNKDFTQEIIDNWPSIYIVMDNNPDVQLMAIESDLEAFENNSTIVNILLSNINKRLRRYKLAVEIQAVYAESEFWKIADEHKNRVTRVQFFMVAPNMANISKNLKFDLKNIKRETNSLHTNVSYQAPPGEALTLSPKDDLTSSLVEYSSQGGGTVHVKVKGLRKVIKTEDRITTFEIDEIHLKAEGDDADKIAQQLIAEVRREFGKNV